MPVQEAALFVCSCCGLVWSPATGCNALSAPLFTHGLGAFWTAGFVPLLHVSSVPNVLTTSLSGCWVVTSGAVSTFDGVPPFGVAFASTETALTPA